MDRNKTCKYIISLIRSLLEDTQPESRPSDVSFDDIYSMAKEHHVRNMCFYALEKLEEKPDPELYGRWEDYSIGSGVQSAMQLEERDSVIRAFQKNKIDCLPLKGCYLKEMYPDPKYREMADLDILIRKESQEAVKKIMEEHGYRAKLYKAHSVHDVYVKPPFTEIEIHLGLISDESNDFHLDTDRLRMLREPWSYALPTDQPYVYTLSPENTYIYLVLHLAMHYFKSGIGIRQFIDLWIYSRKYNLDKNYIYEALESAGFRQFCIDAERLAEEWMTADELDSGLEEMQSYVFSSGAYGTAEHKVANRLERMGENQRGIFRHYLGTRMFPSIEIMKKLYPFLEERPYLLPYAWVRRLIKRSFTGDSPALKELKAFITLRRPGSRHNGSGE